MKLSSVIILASFVSLLVSFWNRNDLPGDIDYVPALDDEPRQTRTIERPFELVYNDVRYRVEPEYDYDITGMVVSYRHHHEDNSRMHRLAKDHLNMLDVCVVWGDNPSNERLDKISFWNGLFTCNVKTRDQQAWDAFDMNQLSNNHLLSEDDFIRRQVKKIRVGDQVRVRGYLASYTSGGGSVRGTSTTRTDTGNGACETIYVKGFEIVQKARNNWRIAMWVSLALLIGGLIVHFSRPYRPH
ncbi:MAG: hypothetical protein KJP17_01420 [Gammaproteobacteria bacterium]|nr:hypothetical protein [Gammaproteobacteria bacterium]